MQTLLIQSAREIPSYICGSESVFAREGTIGFPAVLLA